MLQVHNSHQRTAKFNFRSIFQRVVIKRLPRTTAKRHQWQFMHILRIKLIRRTKTSTWEFQLGAARLPLPAPSGKRSPALTYFKGELLLVWHLKNKILPLLWALKLKRCSRWLFWVHCWAVPIPIHARASLLRVGSAPVMPPVGWHCGRCLWKQR